MSVSFCMEAGPARATGQIATLTYSRSLNASSTLAREVRRRVLLRRLRNDISYRWTFISIARTGLQKTHMSISGAERSTSTGLIHDQTCQSLIWIRELGNRSQLRVRRSHVSGQNPVPFRSHTQIRMNDYVVVSAAQPREPWGSLSVGWPQPTARHPMAMRPQILSGQFMDTFRSPISAVKYRLFREDKMWSS